MTRRLSAQERHVLAHLMRVHAAESQHFGVAWRTEGSRAAQASLSRTLRRLEARGLVRRESVYGERKPGSRTTRVRLLPAAFEAVNEEARC